MEIKESSKDVATELWGTQTPMNTDLLSKKKMCGPSKDLHGGVKAKLGYKIEKKNIKRL